MLSNEALRNEETAIEHGHRCATALEGVGYETDAVTMLDGGKRFVIVMLNPNYTEAPAMRQANAA